MLEFEENALTELPETEAFIERGQAWEIRDGESSIWYHRFRIFLNMGPERSILGAYKLYHEEQNTEPSKYPPQKWYKSAERYDWNMRARTYDQYLLALDQRDNEKLRQAARNMRRELLSVTKKKLLTAIEEWDPDVESLGWKDIGEALKTLLELSRQEFGDTEPQKHMGVNVNVSGGADEFQAALKQVYG